MPDPTAFTDSPATITAAIASAAAGLSALLTKLLSKAGLTDEDRQRLTEIEDSLNSLLSVIQTADVPREKERISAVENDVKAQGRMLEDAVRKLDALHARLDKQEQQLAYLNPDLLRGIQNLADGAAALRIAVEERVPRRSS